MSEQTETWIEWGVTPQAAIDIGNPTHVITFHEAYVREAHQNLGGIIRRRSVTKTVTDWEDVP